MCIALTLKTIKVGSHILPLHRLIRRPLIAETGCAANADMVEAADWLVRNVNTP